ncbi:BA14K family protein [Breoghania sp.]|uniref:BA14K family protein n=1 Tax=Breoghania sp. TaxID=2065378 RepID=UPI002AA8692F|nr:BA14K family protein [Breoghania sp.]
MKPSNGTFLSGKSMLGAALCLLALMWLGAETAAAMPFQAGHQMKRAGAAVAGEAVAAEPVHYRNRRYRSYRYYRPYRPGFSVWFRSGPFVGPYVGVPYRSYGYRPGYYYRRGPVAPPRYYRPRGYGRPVPGTREWYAYCASKYRSFNPRTGLYLAYSGKYRRCR